MTRTVARLSATAVATVLGIATLGCGFISQAKQAVDNLSTISEVAKKLEASEKLTFTAGYQVAGGQIATVVQQPPNSAFIGEDSKFVVTKDVMLMCTTAAGTTTCQRTPNAGGVSGHGSLTTAAAGNGFVSAPMVFAVLTASSLIPGVKVNKSKKKIAGIRSECLKVTGIPKDGNQTTNIDNFSVCISDSGVLTSFSGADTSGRQAGVTITKYREAADPNAFLPPPGAQIVDVGQIQPGG